MNTSDDFISTVSHELRTPLTSIRGFAQTMLGSWDKLDDESKKKFLKIIEQQSNRLINLVENILSVTKLSDENIVLKSVDINSAILPVIQMVSQQYKTHKFETELNKNIPCAAVDIDKFQQIMTNLTENAAKYSEEGTTVTVTTSFSDNSDYVSVKVKDHGIGIDQKDAEKIFTKFSRLDNPLTRKAQGSGLGLYITKTLVEKMNGKISFTSDKNGTVFEVLLPTYNAGERVKCSVTS